jgi:hypothetical protein
LVTVMMATTQQIDLATTSTVTTLSGRMIAMPKDVRKQKGGTIGKIEREDRYKLKRKGEEVRGNGKIDYRGIGIKHQRGKGRGREVGRMGLFMDRVEGRRGRDCLGIGLGDFLLSFVVLNGVVERRD